MVGDLFGAADLLKLRRRRRLPKRRDRARPIRRNAPPVHVNARGTPNGARLVRQQPNLNGPWNSSRADARFGAHAKRIHRPYLSDRRRRRSGVALPCCPRPASLARSTSAECHRLLPSSFPPCPARARQAMPGRFPECRTSPASNRATRGSAQYRSRPRSPSRSTAASCSRRVPGAPQAPWAGSGPRSRRRRIARRNRDRRDLRRPA